jgi:hypothetical protein
MQMHRECTVGAGVWRRVAWAGVQKWEKWGRVRGMGTGFARRSNWREAISKSWLWWKVLMGLELGGESTFQARTGTTSLICISFIVLLRSSRGGRACVGLSALGFVARWHLGLRPRLLWDGPTALALVPGVWTAAVMGRAFSPGACVGDLCRGLLWVGGLGRGLLWDGAPIDAVCGTNGLCFPQKFVSPLVAVGT